MPCGSTIGPITATRLGIDTVDVGVPQLSMHSAREVCGVSDLISLKLALKAYFN
jgi:aspartyl aminopeptidase